MVFPQLWEAQKIKQVCTCNMYYDMVCVCEVNTCVLVCVCTCVLVVGVGCEQRGVGWGSAQQRGSVVSSTLGPRLLVASILKTHAC